MKRDPVFEAPRYDPLKRDAGLEACDTFWVDIVLSSVLTSSWHGLSIRSLDYCQPFLSGAFCCNSR